MDQKHDQPQRQRNCLKSNIPLATTYVQQQHVAQWEKRGERIAKARSYKRQLIEERGFHDNSWELWEAMSTMALERKTVSIRSDGNRCFQCWHDKTKHCICSQLQLLQQPPMSLEDTVLPLSPLLTTTTTSTRTGNIRLKIKLCILMHHKEYLCAGNSAKLLPILFPASSGIITCELYLYGKFGEFERLLQSEILLASSDDSTTNQQKTKNETIILWPDQRNAVLISDFVKTLCDSDSRGVHPPRRNDENAVVVGVTRSAAAEAAEEEKAPRSAGPLSPNGRSTARANERGEETTTTIRAIVLDGTYAQARNMYKSLRERLTMREVVVQDNPQPQRPRVTVVALNPKSESVFLRAQKNYGKAHQNHKQTLFQRVSTAEACGLLLTELGVDPSVQERIVRAVLINNAACPRRTHVPLGKNNKETKNKNRN